MLSLKISPRVLDLDKAFDRLAHWVAETTKEAPGLVVGLSGTDSALAFLLCAKAREIAGKDRDSLVGINFGERYPFKDWFSRYGLVEVRPLPAHDDLDTDAHRWAAIQSYALKRGSWLVGTRNRTEYSLGDYSNASAVAVMQPLAALWKSEVLALCEKLDVPRELVMASWMGDPECSCHRPGLLGRLAECEAILAARQGDIPLEAVHDESFYEDAAGFLKLFTAGKEFKSKIPYRPPANVLDGAVRR